MSACRILIQKWNEDGSKWAEPIAGQQQDDVDCWVKSTSDLSEPVGIQVVRAFSEPELWEELAASRHVQKDIEAEIIAISLKKSIEKKAKSMPESRRAKLCLTLDATRLPGLGFDDVVEYFRNHHSPWARSFGFPSIWLVGPNTRLTWQLD